MSRVFVDDNLLTWEAYASTGNFGLPDHAKIVFHCLSDPHLRARYVTHESDEADAEELVHDVPEERLKAMLAGATELD